MNPLTVFLLGYFAGCVGPISLASLAFLAGSVVGPSLTFVGRCVISGLKSREELTEDSFELLEISSQK